MASSIPVANFEDTFLKLDELHSVDYKLEEVQLIKSKIEAIADSISKRIGAFKPILSNTIVQCGSFYHNSKITAPDEFDFILVLNKLSQPGVCSYKPFPDPEYPHLVSLEIDYKKLGLEPRSVCESDDIDDDHTSKQVVLQATIESDYRNSIRSCLATMPLPDGMSFATSRKSTRVTVGKQTYLDSVKFSGPALTLLLNWKGVHYTSLNISVDMTYVILAKGLPPLCNLEKRLPREHPLIKCGLFAEANHELLYTRMIDDTWRLTCTILENKIMCFWFKENYSSNICYRLLKIIRDLLMPVDQLGGAILKTYALKTLFLCECEQYPDTKFWTKEQLSTRLLSIFQKLLAALQNRFLSNYFNETENALSYPLDSHLDDANSEKDNQFISAVHEAVCKTTKDIICRLESSSTGDQSVQFLLGTIQRTVIADPDIPEPMN